MPLVRHYNTPTSQTQRSMRVKTFVLCWEIQACQSDFSSPHEACPQKSDQGLIFTVSQMDPMDSFQTEHSFQPINTFVVVFCILKATAGSFQLPWLLMVNDFGKISSFGCCDFFIFLFFFLQGLLQKLRSNELDYFGFELLSCTGFPDHSISSSLE